MKQRFLILLSLLFGFAACSQSEYGQLNCEMVQTYTYHIGSNPSVDFDKNFVQRDMTYSNVTCPGGPYRDRTITVSRVRREADQLSVTTDRHTVNQATRTFQISGTEVVPETDMVSAPTNCQLIIDWSGRVNGGTNTIILNANRKYRGFCNHFFEIPEPPQS